MKKIIGFTLLIVCIGLIFGSCSSGMSYSDYVKREKKRINNFKAEHDIVVLPDYPSDGVFKDNEYYLDPSGVYIHVIDSGNGTRAENGAQVYFRFTGASTLPLAESDTVNLSSLSPLPLQFSYGVTTTYTSLNTSDVGYYYLSPSMATPLKYVGEGAVVSLIVPFKGTIGSSYQNSSYTTFFYDRVTYSTIIN